MRTFISFAAAIACGAVLLLGCGDDSGTEPTPQDADVVGVWLGGATVGTMDLQVEADLMDDGSYTITVSQATAALYSESGTYTVSETAVTFAPDTCTPAMCTTSVTVTVVGDSAMEYTYMGQTITLVKTAQMVGQWLGVFPLDSATMLDIAAEFFAVDSTYTIDVSVDTTMLYMEAGTYAVSGTMLTVTADSCTMPQICVQPLTVEVTGNTMDYLYMTAPIVLTKQTP